MSVILVQPPPRVDMVEIVQDPSGKLRGKVTRPWQLYLDDLFVRVGGTNAPSIDDLTDIAGVTPPNSTSELQSMIDSLKQEASIEPVAQLVQSIDDLSTLIIGLRDEISELTKDIQSIRSGSIL